MGIRTLATSLVSVVLAGILSLYLPSATPAATSYTITDLGTLGGSDSFAYGLNSSGQAVGTSDQHNGNPAHAFIYSNGQIHDLGILPGTNQSSASAINNSGQVVGESNDWDTHQNYRAFLWQNGGPMVDLGTLGGSQSEASSINDQGQIVGWSEIASGDRHGFLYQSGQMSDLGTNFPLQVNNAGTIVGSKQIVYGIIEHAFIYQNGQTTDLGTPAGNDCSYATSINSSGQICGTAYTQFQNGFHAWIYQNSGFTDLGSLGGTETTAIGINNAGAVVGTSNLPGDSARHPFIYQNGTLSDLNTLIPANSGWTLDDASGINNAGQIIGDGFIGNGLRGFLLTPVGVPEPATVAISFTFFALTSLRRRRTN